MRALAIIGLLLGCFGFAFSAQAATTWTHAGEINSARVFSIVTDPVNKDIVYAGGVGRVYKSTNGGDSYTTIAVAGHEAEHIVKIVINPKNNKELYLSSGNDLDNYNTLASNCSIAHSLDGGNTWTTIYTIVCIGNGKVAAVLMNPLIFSRLRTRWLADCFD